MPRDLRSNSWASRLHEIHSKWRRPRPTTKSLQSQPEEIPMCLDGVIRGFHNWGLDVEIANEKARGKEKLPRRGKVTKARRSLAFVLSYMDSWANHKYK